MDATDGKIGALASRGPRVSKDGIRLSSVL